MRCAKVADVEGGDILIKTYIVKEGQLPTVEQVKEIEEAVKKPIVFDEDCPELSPAMMKAFKCAVIQRNRRKRDDGS